jgi:hypothetical protein
VHLADNTAALVGPWAAVLLITAAYTGARWGELAGLQRRNTHLNDARIVIDPHIGALHETAASPSDHPKPPNPPAPSPCPPSSPTSYATTSKTTTTPTSSSPPKTTTYAAPTSTASQVGADVADFLVHRWSTQSAPRRLDHASRRSRGVPVLVAWCGRSR